MSIQCPKCDYSLTNQPPECPACGGQLDPVIFTADALVKSADGDEGLTIGQRIAGAALIANAILVMGERVIMTDGEGFASPIGSLIDLALGLMLLGGRRDALAFTKFRAVAGGLLFGGLYLAQGDTVMMVMQVVFSCALIALLFGDAGKLRVAAASVAILGLMGLELVGLQMIMTGEAPAMLMSAQYDSQPLEAEVVESDSHPYRMIAPGDGWERRSDASARTDNPEADVWLVEPGWDAHIMVIAETADAGLVIEIDALTEAVEENARAASEQFEVASRGYVAAVSNLGRQLDANAVIEGRAMRLRYGLFADGRHSVQVVCFAGDKSFPNVEQACDAVLESFQFDESRMLARY